MPETGLHEERARVAFHLPCKNQSEAKAVREVFQYLFSQRTALVPVTGFTHTPLRPTAFTGYWFGRDGDDPESEEKWVKDRIVLVLVDFLVDPDDDALDLAVKQLEAALVGAYSRNECPQTDFWIIAQAVFRLA